MEDSEDDKYYAESIFFEQMLHTIKQAQLKELLHRSIGAITFLNKNKSYSAGSGTLISEDIILTAAHNIYNHENKCENSEFRFYIGAHGIAEDYYEIEAWRYPEEFKSFEKIQLDYAIMKLKKPIQFDKYLSFLQICQSCLPEMKQKWVEIFGFPVRFLDNFISCDKYGKSIKLNQCGLSRKDRIVQINSSRKKITYKISTLPGQSGCPVAVENNIIAVHVGSKKQSNTGRIIDSTFMDNIMKWTEQLKGVKQTIKQNKCTHIQQVSLIIQKNMKNMGLPNYFYFLELNLMQSRIGSIQLSQYRGIKRLNLQQNQLSSIDLTSNSLLTHIDLWTNNLQTIDVRVITHLKYLDLGYNKIQKIDLSNNPQLTELWLQSNKFASIDLSKITDLTKLDVSINNLSFIDLRNNQKLTHLRLRENEIKQIDIRNNPFLKQLSLSHNRLTEISLKNNQVLKSLSLDNNSLTQIDLSSNTKLQYLHLYSNRLLLIILSISGIAKWKYIDRFSLSNQQSNTCRVLVKALLNQYKQKSVDVSRQWNVKYRQGKQNKYNCVYRFIENKGIIISTPSCDR